MEHKRETFVIACGYRYIQSEKTSLRFPAWLISFPGDEQYRWRSKRDFLILFRAAAKHASIKPPKAALEKLAKSGPWKNPACQVGNTFLRSERVSPESAIPDNYHVSMKKSLLLLHHFLRACSRAEPLASVWQEFCRPFDTSGLRSLQEGPTQTAIRSETTSTKESSQLGQYFCTEENATQMIDLALHWTNSNQTHKNKVFLEPSCGHGQIVWKLLEKLPLAEVVGYDIDDNAIRICRQSNNNPSVSWVHGDFLQSSSKWNNCTNTVVVCVGGPPYTSRIGEDLPQLFLDHCIQTWHAEFCALLLPRRYIKTPLRLPHNYSCETHQLSSSTFLFQGKVAVTQPSIIQTFSRRVVANNAE